MSLLHLPVPCPPGCAIPSLGTHIAKGVATAAASTILTAMSDGVVRGASWLVRHIVGLVSPPTRISLGASWFAGRELAMVEIAGLLVGPLVGAATLGAIIRQDGRRLARIFGVGLPVGILGTVTAIALIQKALVLVDALCRLITPPDPYAPLLGLGRALAQQQVPIFVQFIISAVVVLAAVAIWMEMVLRAAVLYIAVFFLPLGLAAFVWPATAHITRRFIEIVVAIIGSKFVIVATLTLGGAAMGPGRGVDGAVTGTAILLLAAFAPFAVLRLVPVVEAAATAHLEGMSRRPARAAMAASNAVSSGARLAGTIGQLGGTGEALPTRAVSAVDVGDRHGSWSVPPAPSPEPSDPSRTGGPANDVPSSAVHDVPSSAVHDVPSSGFSRSDGGGSSGSGGLTGSSPAPAPAAQASGSSRPAPSGGPAPSPAPAPPAPVRPGILGAELDGWSDDA